MSINTIYREYERNLSVFVSNLTSGFITDSLVILKLKNLNGVILINLLVVDERTIVTNGIRATDEDFITNYTTKWAD